MTRKGVLIGVREQSSVVKASKAREEATKSGIFLKVSQRD